jgi:hypothetical protein
METLYPASLDENNVKTNANCNLEEQIKNIINESMVELEQVYLPQYRD